MLNKYIYTFLVNIEGFCFHNSGQYIFKPKSYRVQERRKETLWRDQETKSPVRLFHFIIDGTCQLIGYNPGHYTFDLINAFGMVFHALTVVILASKNINAIRYE